ncbi:hypothetical protein SLS60_004701 [Paraconiothyrium brasiliense]|uniref:Uncharacterized protein n=1 Tax=Paraconiothyrium brasiliense TaxID=300254 RepID=A0ABR3RLU3_9PLEO
MMPTTITLHGSEAWDTHQAFKKKLDGREKETYKIIDSYDLPGGGKCIDNCGVTYKLSKTDSLVGGVGGNQVQFEYSTRKGLFYYDLSFVDCAKDIDYRKGNAERCPGWDAGLKIVGKKACKEMYCGEGKMCIYDGQGAYYIDQPVQKWGLGEPVGTCPDYDEGTEIGFVLCTSAPPLVKE